jgi:ankyrin repeat protein
MEILLENINQDRGTTLLQCKDKDGNNPLHISCIYRTLEVMRVLVIEREDEVVIENLNSVPVPSSTSTASNNNDNVDGDSAKKSNNKKAKKTKRPKSKGLKFPGVSRHRNKKGEPEPATTEEQPANINNNNNNNNSNSERSSLSDSTSSSASTYSTTTTTTEIVKVIDKELLHSKNNKGNTPLHCCMESSGNLNEIQQCVTFLVECGADIRITNEARKSPMDLAKELSIRL